MNALFVICGVSASGKSTFGRELSIRLNCPFLEGDDYHPQSNIDKMRAQTPLTDHDRIGWVKAITIAVNQLSSPKAILACSALTPFVQSELIRLCQADIIWIKLELSLETALTRSKSRQHFMPPDLIYSQFDAWSPPKSGLSINAEQGLDNMISDTLSKIKAVKPELI